MNILLTTMNAKYIHKNLALRWIYQACPDKENVTLKEYTIKEDIHHIAQEILHQNFDVVAFSTYIWNIEPLKKLIAILKEYRPHIHIIAGGPEVSFESKELLDIGVDALSIGEGEQSIWEYIEMLQTKDIHNIIGMCTKQFPNTIYRKVSLEYLETLPDPYFLEMDKGQMDKQYLYLETSRGCPYHCAYCLSSIDTCVRMFSDTYVFKILEKIAKSNIRQVKLLDRTFNANPMRALKIARYMNENCLRQTFQFEVVAETLSDDLLRFFCEEADKKRFRLEIGVQSFYSETLQAVGRIQNNDRLKEVIFALRDAGVMMHVDLIAGLPYEDYATFRKSFDTLFAFEVKEIQLGILKLLKGTRLKQQKKEYAFTEEKQAPYTVKKTKWLSYEELDLIDGAAMACEKFYNSGRLRDSILTFLQLSWFQSPFDLFIEIGKEYRHIPHPYPVQALYRICVNILPYELQTTGKAILTMEYYKHFKQRPVRLWKDMVSTDMRKQLFQYLMDEGIETSYDLYHYGVADIGYMHQKIGYQVIVYQKDGMQPHRYFVEEHLQRIEEIRK